MRIENAPIKNELEKARFLPLFAILCFFSADKLAYSAQGCSFGGKKQINMLPSTCPSWLYALLVNMCKQQQVVDSKPGKNNSRIEI